MEGRGWSGLDQNSLWACIKLSNNKKNKRSHWKLDALIFSWVSDIMGSQETWSCEVLASTEELHDSGLLSTHGTTHVGKAKES